MSYFTGSAANMAAVRTALIDNAQLAGWAWSAAAQELSKAGAVLYVPAVASNKLLVTGRTASGTGSAPNAVGIDGAGIGGVAVTWPVIWHLHAIGNELFFAVAYGDRYQWIFAGAGTVVGNPGTGMAVAGSCANETPTSGISINSTGEFYGGNQNCTPAPFFSIWFAASGPQAGNWYVHSDLDGQGWFGAQTRDGYMVGIKSAIPMLGLLPSAWSSNAVLLPCRAHKIRPSGTVSLTYDSDLLRITRNDNHPPGGVIQVGVDRWMIYPAYRKNIASRAGGSYLQHSGTFAIAVRYDGP